MGKLSRNKGADGEREVVNILKKAGIPAMRTSMMESGNIVKGDVLVAGIWKAEVKVGDSVVPKFLYDARKEGEVLLIVKRDRKKWQICMDLDFFIERFV